MTKFFSPKKIIITEQASPNRIYVNSFLNEKLKEIILLKEINVLDIGCGSGYIREILFNLGYKVNYTGLDIAKHDNFDRYSQFALSSRFIESKIEDFQTKERFDVIFSICALEHIEDNESAISNSKQLLKEGGIQIHVIPSKISYLLYLQHGYRRYSPSKLKRLFNKEIKIYRIGGLFSFLTHFFLITVLKRTFKSTRLYHSSLYPKIIKFNSIFDRVLPICSTMYIVTSNK